MAIRVIPDPLEFAYRCYQTDARRPGSAHTRRKPSRRRNRVPDVVLVFDAETTTDEAQRLTFLSYRFLQRVDDTAAYLCAEEGLAYADDLPARDPEGFLTLKNYVAHHDAAVTRSDVPKQLKLMSQSQFL